MIEIATALKLIAAETRPLAAETVPFSQVVGRRLVRPVIADVDSPPHDKSLMDGFAVRSKDIQKPGVRLKVIDTILAGSFSSQPLTAGTAIRIMTGAPIPSGADAVVMLEHTDFNPEANSVIVHEPVVAGRNIMRRSQSMREGEVVLPERHLIRPHDVGLLAEVGMHELEVYSKPTMAVLATGDELVTAAEKPAIAHIRNSNGPMLSALAARVAKSVRDLGIARDNRESLKEKIQAGLEADLLVLSGGVSAGIVDLVPQVLSECGVRQVFHKVSIKPGKPIWFGVRDTGPRRQYVFGLPGNPVSTLACFEVFVVACWQMLTGNMSPERKMTSGVLATDHVVRGGRPTYWPVTTIVDEIGFTRIHPLAWQGSSDLKCLAEADSLAFFPPRESAYQSGECVEILRLNQSP
jgi:molybdopterin molybdotransferase